MLNPKHVSQLFGRPFINGVERKGTITTGSLEAVRHTATNILKQAPDLLYACGVLQGTQ
jgi:hypothetical protein